VSFITNFYSSLLRTTCLSLFLFAVHGQAVSAAEINEQGFDDSILSEAIKTPEWFKLSFLDINEDVSEAKANGKKGLLLYFGMEKCPYCKALLEDNFGKKDISSYTQENFDVVAIDVKGNRTVTTVTGEDISEKDFSIRQKANFTPTLIFYDHNGTEVHRMVGYYKPYTFRAALEYVADTHYKTEVFRDFLARGEFINKPEKALLNYRAFSMHPPYALQRNIINAQRPLLVIFEQGDCHACDVLHAGVFADEGILEKAHKLDIVQLDMWSNNKIIDINGKKITAGEWAESLGIFYTPTLVFYSRSGKEIIRLGSVAHFNRLTNVINYVVEDGYLKHKNLAEWNSKKH